METLRAQLRNPLVAGIVGGIVGLILGLIWAWQIQPVKWTDAGPQHLSDANKAEYLRMAMQAYALTGDLQTAKARYESLGDDRKDILAEVLKDAGSLPPQSVTAFGLLAGEAPVAVQPTTPGGAVATPAPGGLIPTVPPGGAIQPTVAPGAGTKGGSFLSSLLPILCVVLLLVLAAAGVFFYLQNRRGPATPRTMTPAQQAQQAARQAAYTDYSTSGMEPPIAQFMASYKLGDDLFDDSFSIDSPAGEFMGECGVGISETIGVGDPKKVTAFEVWLFDKNDIQTVTKVLMSAHAFNDEGLKQRLAAKGTPVLAQPGGEAVLETQTLQMVARVVDMAYGEGALPSESFFDRFIIELSIWPKSV